VRHLISVLETESASMELASVTLALLVPHVILLAILGVIVLWVVTRIKTEDSAKQQGMGLRFASVNLSTPVLGAKTRQRRIFSMIISTVGTQLEPSSLVLSACWL